jgi:hypothetical protein
MLRVDLIEGFGLPEMECCYVHICMGEYTIKTGKYNVKEGFCEFYDSLDEKKINLPENSDSMPDLVVYLCNGLK